MNIRSSSSQSLGDRLCSRRTCVLSVLFVPLVSLTFASIAIYRGTVNDPTTFPPPNRAHGSHHWAFERLLSAALVPLTAAAFVSSPSAYPIIDGLLGISLVVHSHIGVSTCISNSTTYTPRITTSKWDDTFRSSPAFHRQYTYSIWFYISCVDNFFYFFMWEGHGLRLTHAYLLV